MGRSGTGDPERSGQVCQLKLRDGRVVRYVTKFRRGCADEWERNAAELVACARVMLVPTLQTLIFGDRPTLADAFYW